MKQTCSKCSSLIEIYEDEYTPGEQIIVRCSNCNNNVVFNIPKPEIDPPDSKDKNVPVDPKDNDNNGKESPKKKKESKGGNDNCSGEKKDEEQNKGKNDLNKTEKEKSKKTDEKENNTDGPSKKGPSKVGPSKGLIWIIIIGCVALIGFCIFYYLKFFIPRNRDNNAPRYYTIASPHVFLRNSKSSGGEYNKIDELQYGTALITYEVDSKWLKVKTEKGSENGEQKEGYVSAMYTLEKHDFFILNSIWGDEDSKTVIRSTKCRRALLNYFKEHDYIGDISDEERKAAGIHTTPNMNNQWQVFSKPDGSYTNTTYFKRLINKESKFTDFAVIIKNINTGDRKMLYFTFNDDETPVFYAEYAAPPYGYIRRIEMTNSGALDICYTQRQRP